jgi:Flp pilus assembly CpaE family ATPase
MLAAIQFREIAIALNMRDRLLLVINRADSGIEPSKVEEVVGIPSLARIRSAGRLFYQASDAGMSAVESSPGDKAIGDIERLADRLLATLDAAEHRGVGHRPRRGIAGSVRGLFDRVTG